MNKKFIILSILVISTGIASGIFLGLRASESKKSTTASTPRHGVLPNEDAVNFSKIKNCFPSDFAASPAYVQKLEYKDRVFYQSHQMFFEVNDFGVCQKLDIPEQHPNLSEHLPKEFAVDLKKRYWTNILEDTSPEGRQELLNSPYSYGPHALSHPFFPEDVEALKQLGHTVGPKASVFQTNEEYLKADPYFPIVEEGSRKADEILEKRRRQQQKQP